jgi:hypothetical protein
MGTSHASDSMRRYEIVTFRTHAQPPIIARKPAAKIQSWHTCHHYRFMLSISSCSFSESKLDLNTCRIL